METPYYKYPRTFHVPWSPGATSDDKTLRSMDQFEGKEIVVTHKLDGENTSLYRDHYHARSIDSKHHQSQSIVKQLHASIAHEIPPMWRIAGENLYAKHSIHYPELASFFYVFGIYNENNVCLSWDDTKLFAGALGLLTVPVIYQGLYDSEILEACYTGEGIFGGEQEGYVVRCAGAFCYCDHAKCTAKWVRPNHVQTDTHWRESWTPNELAD